MRCVPQIIKRSILILILITGTLMLQAKNEKRIDSLKNVIASTQGNEQAEAMYDLFKAYHPFDMPGMVSATSGLERLAAQSQSKEILLKAWAARANIYSRQSKFDSLGLLCHHAIALSRQVKDSIKLSVFYNLMGGYQENVGTIDSAIYYYQASLETGYEKLNIYNNLGKAYNVKGEYHKGIEILELAIIEAQQRGLTNSEAVISNNIAIAHYYLGNTDRAINYCLKSMELKDQIGDEHGKLYALSNLADFTLSQEDHKQYVAMGKKIAQASANPNHIRLFEAHQAMVYLKEGKYQQGIDLLLPVYQIAAQAPSYEFTSILNALSLLYLKTDNLAEAEKYSLEGEAWAQKSKSTNDLHIAQKNLLNVYQAQKNYQRFFEVATAYHPARDSLNEKAALSKMAYLDAKLANVEQEKAIKLLNTTLRQKEITRYWIMALSFLTALILSLILYLRIRQVKAQKEKIAQEQETAKTLEAMNQKLKGLDEAKTHFFTNISHEFRTPLTIISGMAGQIRKNPKQWTEKGLQMIERNSKNLLQLINQILDLRKLESKAFEVHYLQGDVIQYLRYITESHQSLANNKNLQLHFLSQTDSLQMDYDADKLMKIVSNLLSNAVKFTPEGGNIYFQLDQKEVAGKAILQIQVKDTGTGISEKKLPRIFDRFYQADDSSTRKGEGTGIGLSLTKELVEVLGGHIEVSSLLGKGSTFLVQLPISNKAPLEEEENPSALAPPLLEKTAMPLAPPVTIFDTDRPKILVVEDNADVQQYLIACLKDTYQLDLVNNGQEGINRAIESIPDLIVSDVMMPEKDGYELCEALKTDERTNHIPIVLLTAKADTDSRISGFEKGADAYLSKPFEPKELLLRLRNMMELQKRIQQQNALSDKAINNTADPRALIEDPFLQKIYDLVHENLSDADYGLPRICRALGRSRSQVFRKVKALTGHPPTIFIRSIRLQESKKLLATTDLTIAEIAYDVGFTSPNYFSTAFLEEFGSRPSATRN